MDLGLGGKIAIVTGASAGIGLACSKALYKEGASVVMVARDSVRLQKAVDSFVENYTAESPSRIVMVAGDMGDPATSRTVVSTALDRYGRIDIVINNAGSAKAGAFFELSEDVFTEAWNLKLLGYIRMVKEAAPYMISQKDGRIVNIIGGAAERQALPFWQAVRLMLLCLILQEGFPRNWLNPMSESMRSHQVRQQRKGQRH